MEFLASLFVGKPQNIALVSILFLVIFVISYYQNKKIVSHSRSLLTIAFIWGAYAIWEWIVNIQTPEANIRVDLLVIWPLLSIVTFWNLYRFFRSE